MEYTQEELAVLVAMDKTIGHKLKDAKEQFKRRVIELEAEEGVERLGIKVGGTKVGTVSVRRGKPKFVMLPGEEEAALDVLEAMGLTERQPKKGWEEHFQIVGGCVVSDTGELVDSITYVEGAVTAAVSGFKPEDVTGAFATEGRFMEDVTTHLLNGGPDE